MDDLSKFLEDNNLKNGGIFNAKVIFKKRNLNNGEDCNMTNTDTVSKVTVSVSPTYSFDVSPKTKEDFPIFSEKTNIFIYIKDIEFGDEKSLQDLLIITGNKENIIYAYFFYDIHEEIK